MKAKYKIIIFLSSCLLIAIPALSQGYYDKYEYSDPLKDAKLKGKVLSMQYHMYGYKFKFGEYERDDTPKDISPIVIYNQDGKISMVIYDDECEKFTYQNGKLLAIHNITLVTKKDCNSHKVGERGKIKAEKLKEYRSIYETGESYETFDTTFKKEYIYDDDKIIETNTYYYKTLCFLLRRKMIPPYHDSEGNATYYNNISKLSNENMDTLKHYAYKDGEIAVVYYYFLAKTQELSEKIKYKYTQTGYERKTYNGNGEEEYYVSMDGKTKKEGSSRYECVTKYNNNMLPVEISIISYYGTALDINGRLVANKDDVTIAPYDGEDLKRSGFYKYNDNGDVISISEAPDGEPLLTYQYIYDKENNWTELKEYYKDKPRLNIIRTITYAKDNNDYDSVINNSKYSKSYIDKEIARLKAIKEQHVIEDSIKEAKRIAEIKRKQAIEDSIKMVKDLKDVYSDCLFLFDNDKDFVSCMLQENDKKMKDLTSRISKKIQNVSSVVINGKELLDKNLGAGEKMQDICNAYLIFEKEFGYDAEVTRETRNQLEEFVQSRKNLKNKFRQFSTNSGGYGLQLCAFLTCYIMGL